MMKKIIAITTLSTLLLGLAPVVSANGNLVVNGSFEEPIVGAPQQWDVYVTSEVPGWNIEWRSDLPGSYQGYGRPEPQLELHHGVNGWLSQEGDQYAELDTDWDGPTGSLSNEPASVKIYQDVPTNENCLYSMTFYFSPRPGTPEGDNMLEVKWGGSVLANLPADGSGNGNTDWGYYEYNDLPGSTVSTRIEFTDEGTANSLGTFLDNVVVTETSCEEPADQIDEGNTACVLNKQFALTNTGLNGIGNSLSFGGDSEAEDNDGNTILTGDAWSEARSITIANSNIKRDCCEGNQINVGNVAHVSNFQVSLSNTGLNGIGNSKAEGGMQFPGDGVQLQSGRRGRGGSDSEAEGNDDNIIITGNAVASAKAFTIVNTNIERGITFPEFPER